MKLPNDISSCHELIKVQQELIAALLQQSEEVNALRSKVAELEARLNKNSQNSHKPPSSDGFKKPRRKPAFPRKKNKKRGGQPGHKGRTLEMSAQIDDTVIHRPEKCTCGHTLSGSKGELVEKRQVFDLPEPRLEVVEHQVHSCTCGQCGKVSVGEFPIEVPARVQYGSGVRALSTLLNNGLNMPYGKVRRLFCDLFGYELNESTQTSAQQRCYERLEPEEARIKTALLNSMTNHYDESGIRIDCKLQWLHACTNEQYTYLFVHPKRGRQALDSEASLLPHFHNWAIHDRWASYFLYNNCQHADCGAHLLRDLQGLIDQGSQWAQQMHELLLMAYQKSDYGRSVATNPKTIDKKYDKICRLAQKEEPPPVQRFKGKRSKRTKGRNLLEHLEKYKDAVLAFAMNEAVPFTNNQAERDIRPVKVKQKVSGCFRTQKGAQQYARIQGFISTARKQQLNVFNELLAIFQGKKSSFAF